ncbi:MAG: hypothetical protein ACU88J_13730 [Gammaproteobacteria bacterium]
MSILNFLKRIPYSAYVWIKAIRYDWYVLIGLMSLSIVGVGYTDAAQRASHWYWLAMVPVFFITCLFIEWKAARETGISARSIVIKQVQHWLGLLAAVYLTFFLRDFGRLDNESTGLILLLVFALTTFLAGVTMGWLFRLLGVFLGLSLFFVAYVENYIWVIIGMSILILIAYHFLARYFGHGLVKNNDDIN